MRWSAESSTVWPPDVVWQRVWQSGARDLLATTVDASGLVSAIDPTDTSRPDLRLVSGSHLQPGAEYRLAPHVTTGVLRGWVAAGRTAGLEWAPHAESGRADLEVDGLDRLSAVRADSTLHYLSGRLRFAVDPDQLFEVEAEVPWLRVEASAHVVGGRLRVDLRVRGLGVWWPALAPLFAAASSKIQQGLDETVQGLAEGLTSLPTADTTPRFVPRRPTAEDREAAARRDLDAGFAEVGRRQRAVADAFAALSWWRRTSRNRRRLLDDLPPGVWPSDDVLGPLFWSDLEARVTGGASLEDVATEQLEAWRERDRRIQELVPAPATEGPWLTDASTDLSWLATPWTTIRHVTGAATDEEARAHAEELVAEPLS